MDILIYQPTQPVGVRVIATDALQWSAVLSLSYPVQAIYLVRFKGFDVTQLYLSSQQELVVTIPLDSRGLDLAQTLASGTFVVTATPLYVNSGQGFRAGISLGFGATPQVAEGPVEAMQRCLRFLLRASDPVSQRPCGGLRESLRSGFFDTVQASRLITLACERYNTHQSRSLGRDGYSVTNIRLVRVETRRTSALDEHHRSLLPTTVNDGDTVYLVTLEAKVASIRGSISQLLGVAV